MKSAPGLAPTDRFEDRHIGPQAGEIARMLADLGCASLPELIEQVLPQSIRAAEDLDLPEPRDEAEALSDLREIADINLPYRSLIGMGYHDTITPPVILRNVLENPGWYTAYTPYQAEISQGRLEALLLFQTMVSELCGLPVSNASLLDEATAAAEAMTMAHRLSASDRSTLLVSERMHPQTLALLATRAAPLGIQVEVRADDKLQASLNDGAFAVMVQYPDTEGAISDWRPLAQAAHANGALFIVATDLLSLTLLTPPGELGADIAFGSSQRFGVPLGYGGPHAAFLACKEDHKRQIPGRLIGISKDANGRPALRMALQTREQHIRRQKATSNICTAQVLLAVVAAMYAVWHGPEGLRRIATRLRQLAARVAEGAWVAGLSVSDFVAFDTLRVDAADAGARDALMGRALDQGINLRPLGETGLGISLDETCSLETVEQLWSIFGAEGSPSADPAPLPDWAARQSGYLGHPHFHQHRSETEMLRFLHRLQVKDLALDAAMIPLGSCTMKLNATTEMIPVTWRSFGGVHPFAPVEQALGYTTLFSQLEMWLAEITGFHSVSLQPNAGSQGEYAGLLCIDAWHQSRGEGHRKICLIPSSAHGTNPASAVMVGMEVVVVNCDARGNVDIDDLRRKSTEHAARLGALMITYPSTHGVFEEGIREICQIVHEAGGQVYMDGANMNAMVGLARPGDIGADVLHLNLHKTFCIPHGGGGPGMGPIGVAEHLAPFLPGHPVVPTGRDAPPVSAAPWGSASILPISWAYIAMMGAQGLKKATSVAILNANYMANRLHPHFPVLYSGRNGRVAHECILDLRGFKKAGVEAEDVAKRLMDYGFHAPTMSFPVAGTLMIEPTESESLYELDRFCDAMIAIRGEIRAIEEGRIKAADSPLKHAPHTAEVVTADSWTRAYSRQEAAFPAPWSRESKYWPTVGRIDNTWGDRNLFCSCNAWEQVEKA